ncbi:MAG TPA: VWA domain-containing protein, partial [Pirellulaceae bacterium]|nr:VWA domain-containing protein [Pirellulaceae bacterium]
MSKRCQYLLAAAPAITLALTAALLAAPPGPSRDSTARLATYDKASGSTHFALSLTPPPAAGSAQHDIVVLVDTSASQSGVFREDSLAALRSLLDNLGQNDRVKLVAVDIDAVALNDKFVAPNSPEMQAALDKLSARTPLGSTDMVKAMHAAAGSFGDAQADSRAVVYIGDGVSKAQILGSAKFTAATQELVKNRLPVTSYAVGPACDVQTLAALANQTGGNLYVGTQAQPSAQEIGVMLAKAAQVPVYYPTKTSLPTEMTQSFPQVCPPLRSDRDSIVIGDLSAPGNMQIAMQAEVAGKPVQLSWTVAAEASNPDFSFLPELIEIAKKDNGASLPTVGSAGLREAGRTMVANADHLAKLGKAALAAGDNAGAKAAADLAIQRDPENAQALAIRNVALQDAPAAAAEAAPAAPATGGAAADLKLQGETDGSLLDAFERDQGNLLGTERTRRDVQSQLIKTTVENALIEARKEMMTNPDNVENNLKLELQGVESAPELDPEVRSQLRGKLESAIKEARRVNIIVSEQRAADEDRIAAAKAQVQLLEETFRKQERIKQLMSRFEALMDEGKYRQAEEEVAVEVRRLDDSPTARVARFDSQFVRSIDRMDKIFEERQKGYFDVLALVEESHIPFPDEPPLVFPEAEFWEKITKDREKWKKNDLAKPNSSEARIFQALDEPVRSFEFFEAALSEVITSLKEFHDIPIVVDERALMDASIGTDTLITKSLKGISLRSALRLMLKDHNLSYVVKDEVLVITTKEEAETTLTTRRYSVADLVLPISSGAVA